MAIYITIDGGTTNTRISLVKERSVIDTVKLARGARSCIDDKTGFIREIGDAISSVITKNGLTTADICKILASGMITSEFGLCPLEHVTVPAGIKQLRDSAYETTISGISELEFVFIRGVKIVSDTLKHTDMMRGEETELIGLAPKPCKNSVYVLPGSHSKLIRTDDEGRIIDFSTMLTGEMVVALSSGTILKDAVDLSVSTIDEEYLLMGYDYCRDNGINAALFKSRILKNVFGCNKIGIYNFFLGAVLYGEIAEIIKNDVKTVVIGGQSQLKQAEAIILKAKTEKTVIVVSDFDVANSTALGMVKIYEYKSQ